MKEYLPVIERLFIAIAFFVLGWFGHSQFTGPCNLKPDVQIIYKDNKMDTIVKEKLVYIDNTLKRLVVIKEKLKKVQDTLKNVDNDSITKSDLINIGYEQAIIIETQDSIIRNQHEVIDTLVNQRIDLVNQIDSCHKKHQTMDKIIDIYEEQIIREKKIKSVLWTSIAAIGSGIIGYLLHK